MVSLRVPKSGSSMVGSPIVSSVVMRRRRCVTSTLPTVARKAKQLILSSSVDRCAMTVLLTASELDYRFEGDGLSPKDQLSLLLFSLALWRTSCFYRNRNVTSSAIDRDARKVASAFGRLRSKTLSARTKKATKAAKAKPQVGHLKALRESLGRHLEVATDGSCIDNPGESGAGFKIVMREVGYGSRGYCCVLGRPSRG